MDSRLLIPEETTFLIKLNADLTSIWCSKSLNSKLSFVEHHDCFSDFTIILFAYFEAHHKLIKWSQINSYCITLLNNRAIKNTKELFFCAEIISSCSETLKELVFLIFFQYDLRNILSPILSPLVKSQVKLWIFEVNFFANRRDHLTVLCVQSFIATTKTVATTETAALVFIQFTILLF